MSIPSARPTKYKAGDIVETFFWVGRKVQAQSVVLVIDFCGIITGSTDLEEYSGYYLVDTHPHDCRVFSFDKVYYDPLSDLNKKVNK